MSDSRSTPGIPEAFLAARYVIETPDSDLVLHIDQPSEAAQALLTALGANCAAIITAHNPAAASTDSSPNMAAQEALEHDAQALGLICLHGYNSAGDGGPPVEPTVVLVDPARAESDALARRYGQLAYVLVDKNGTPRLVWL